MNKRRKLQFGPVSTANPTRFEIAFYASSAKNIPGFAEAVSFDEWLRGYRSELRTKRLKVVRS